jgi:hypothetical protein
MTYKKELLGEMYEYADSFSMHGFLILLLILTISRVQAGQSVPVEDLYPCHSRLYAAKMTAVKAAQSGVLTDALNDLQDTLHRPHIVGEVWYDIQDDCFHWMGPATDKEMRMSRVRFWREVWVPSWR